MNQVIEAKKAYSTGRTLYCVRTSDQRQYIPGSQLIVIYDLDNDNTKRIGFPGNPFGNMFFKNSDKMVYFDYYLAFNSVDAVPSEYSEINVFNVNEDTLLVNSDKTIIRETKKMN